MQITAKQKALKIVRMFSSRFQESEGVGCTENELEILQQSQKVNRLPEVFRQLMMLIGKQKLFGEIGAEIRHYNDFLKHDPKGMFLSTCENYDNIAYPPDIFVFHHTQGEWFNFFRAENAGDDPPVYSYLEEEGCFHKQADSFTEYCLQIRRNRMDQKIAEAQWHKINEVDYFFDSEDDDFYSKEPFPFDDPIPLDQLIDMLESRFTFHLRGCTDDELEDLRKAQGVDCLPDTYQQLMQLMGAKDIDKVLGRWGTKDCAGLRSAKQLFQSKLEQRHVQCPNDVFVFWVDHMERNFYFFRTKGCPDNPPVFYGFGIYGDFVKCSDSVSQFFLQYLDHSNYRCAIRAQKRRESAVYYDPESDEFLSR